MSPRDGTGLTACRLVDGSAMIAIRKARGLASDRTSFGLDDRLMLDTAVRSGASSFRKRPVIEAPNARMRASFAPPRGFDR